MSDDRENGFTLVEMVCVLALIAMMAAVLLPFVPHQTSRSRLEGHALQAATLLKADRNAAIRRGVDVSGETTDRPGFATVPARSLANLLAVLGADEKIATGVAGRIIGWRTQPKANAANQEKSFRILTTIRFDNGRRKSSEVVIALGEDKDNKEPYQALSWQDDGEAGHRPRKQAGG